jgi:putative ABC transport system permease protein
MLVRTPGTSSIVIIVLALGIGTTTAVFTVINALLLRPLPFPEAERIVWIYQDSDDGVPGSNSFPATQDMAAFTDVFSGVASFSPRALTFDTGFLTRQVAAEFVTSNYLDVLGLAPARGRWFEAHEDTPGAGLVAVVSWPAWHALFEADPDIVGRAVRLNGQSVSVVGVGPRELASSVPGQATDFWLSISTTPVGGAFQVANLERREDHWYITRARLRDGVSVAGARAAMNVLADRLAADFPELNEGRRITVHSARDVRIHPDGDGPLRAASAALLAVAFVVLLIACANVANLLLVRGIGRARELAVRQALGAGRGRLVSLLLTESMALALAGGALGVGLAAAAASLLERYPPPIPVALGELRLDGRVLGFGLVLALATGLGVGLIAAWRATRQAPRAALQDGSRSSTGGRATGRLRSVLVGAQVALSLALLLGAGLLGRSLMRVRDASPGFDPAGLAYMVVDASVPAADGVATGPLFLELREAVAALPNVDAVALAGRLPVSPRVGTSTVIVEDAVVEQAGTSGIELPVAVVDDGFFGTLGIPLRSGRLFSASDPAAATQVVVNEAMASTYWGTTDVIGRRFRGQGSDTWLQVIGVVGDVALSSVGERARPQAYRSLAVDGGPTTFVVVRTRSEPVAMLAELRTVAERVVPGALIPSTGTMRDRMAASLAPRETAVAFLGLFAVFALLLASFGLYAVVAFAVRTRTAEIGLRMALGAGRGGIARLVVGQVLRVAGVGIAAGLIMGAGIGRVMAGFVNGVEPLDPVAFAGIPLLLAGVAAAAAYLPVRRAMDVHPAVALRGEP